MKGLETIPSYSDLEEAYVHLQRGVTHEPGLGSERTGFGREWVEKLALWTQWARLDPRLAELWVAYFAQHWQQVSPVDWNERVQRLPWPSAAGPLFEQIRVLVLKGAQKRFFGQWVECAMNQVAIASGELYFIGLRSFGGALMQKDAFNPLTTYVRWGYYGRELLINKAFSKAQGKGLPTLVAPAIRKRILSELVDQNRSFSTQDYRDAVGGALGLRQAELDLKNDPGLQSVGNTQARLYRKQSKKTLR